MRVNEIYQSIQGEGIHAGLPTIFIRLQGCNLAEPCSWCDTCYAQTLGGGEELSLKDIFSRMQELPYLAAPESWVCVTGGEPLLQKEELKSLIMELDRSRYLIEIETNGTLSLPGWWESVDSWCVDVKCPSSGVEAPTSWSWVYRLRSCDQLKFVVQDEKDLAFAALILEYSAPKGPSILISPATPLGEKQPTKEWLQRCTDFVIQHNLRLSLQLHKIIWDANKKGV